MDDDRRVKPEDYDTRLMTLKAAHRALDERINQLVLEPTISLLELQRLKKQKLVLKDRIAHLERYRIPDIIA
ncbi:YdcH family protein [Arboricoccus pini]|nr:YdcH family protein [Arboricoccus pini]